MKNIENPPASVRRTINFFHEKKLWFVLSRNPESRSCRDAVQKRYRIGNIGIPLHDELKSFFGKYKIDDDKWRYVILHCRADQDLNWNKAEAAIGIPGKDIERLSEIEMLEYFGLQYGTVNPFTLDNEFLMLPILQVFDDSILTNPLPPYTMMTNAGDLTWGIEFDPGELVNVIENVKVADVTNAPSSIASKVKHKIAIITGNAPDSGIKLWQDFNKEIRHRMGKSFSGDLSYPDMHIHSFPEMGLSMELKPREEQTWKYIKVSILKFAAEGCTMLALACNTTQYYSNRINRILKGSKMRLFSMPDALDQYLKINQIDTFDFLGISYVTDFENWSAFGDLNKKYKIIVPEKSALDKINELAFLVKQKNVSGEGINKLRDLINKSTVTDTVIIALTEISILMSSQKSKSKRGKTYIDTLELLASSMADSYFSHS